MNGTACKRTTVFAFGVDNNGEMDFATNENYNEGGCTNEPGKCGCTHAEINLLKKIPNPVAVYVTFSPCINCAKALVEAGVEKVTYVKDYRLKEGREYLLEHNVKLSQVVVTDEDRGFFK